MSIIFVQISMQELHRQALIRAIRSSVSTLALSAAAAPDFLTKLQSETPNVTLDYHGRLVWQDLSIFEATDDEILNGKGAAKREAIRVWFRDHFLTPVPEGVAVNYTDIGRKRCCVAANIIGAAIPEISRSWPRLAQLDPSNDNLIRWIGDNDNTAPG